MLCDLYIGDSTLKGELCFSIDFVYMETMFQNSNMSIAYNGQSQKQTLFCSICALFSRNVKTIYI